MKNLLLVFLFSFLHSQQADAQLNFFEAEGNFYYEAAGAVPNSDVEFYSEKWGGKLLRKATTNNEGNLSIKTDLSFKPAFVLNRSAANKDGLKGNGFVHFLSSKEFCFKNLTVTSTPTGNVEVSWLASIDKDQSITFIIFKSADGINYSLFKKVYGASNTEEQQYAITDNEILTVGFYKVEIMHSTKGKRYTSNVMALSNETINVYPTMASDKINIVTNKAFQNPEYKIIDQQGHVIATGIMRESQTVIPIDQLASGAYFIIVGQKENQSTKRFIKL